MRGLVLLLVASVAVIVAASAPAAGAATRRATDSEARVRFTLDGRLLTVRTLPWAPRRVRRQLYGKRFRAVCGTSFFFTRGVKVRRTRVWPQGRRRLRLRFRRDISPRAEWCLLEHRRGGDVAFAGFPASVPSDCSADATSQILAWIASVPDHSTLRFGPRACYRIEGTLELRDRKLTLDGNGATFRSVNPPASQRAMWRAWNSDINFRNMSIVGSYANGGVFDRTLQHAHAIDLRGSHGSVENVAMSDVAGDCVYFGLGTARSSGGVRDSSCVRIGRNAVSVSAGGDIRVERVRTNRVGYIVFDVEPNTGSGFGAQRVVFDSNTIGSYYMKAYTIIGNAPVVEQAFTNNRLVGESLRIGVIDRGHRPQGVRIAGNTSDTAASNNAMTLYGITGLTVTGNRVPLTTGNMAYVSASCAVDVWGNAFPGGSREAFITNPAC